ncbi:hypothetical protein RND71_042102 [Anisodus tanguticus]|uniref:Uncharacterized protein n=1 Tax=Anisodus tanguticus TaxID=243964 RepID=A0AAE1UUA9_9SOLA|nr:hypothetical protein RND71_042102 [Anisodus tanguticus]
MKDFIHKNVVFVQFDVQENVGVKNLELVKLQNKSNKAFGGEMRPPIFDELNTSVSHVGDLVSSHMHDLRSE